MLEKNWLQPVANLAIGIDLALLIGTRQPQFSNEQTNEFDDVETQRHQTCLFLGPKVPREISYKTSGSLATNIKCKNKLF